MTQGPNKWVIPSGKTNMAGFFPHVKNRQYIWFFQGAAIFQPAMWLYQSVIWTWNSWVDPPKVSQFAPEKLPGPNRKGSSSNHNFLRSELLNFGGVHAIFSSLPDAECSPLSYRFAANDPSWDASWWPGNLSSTQTIFATPFLIQWFPLTGWCCILPSFNSEQKPTQIWAFSPLAAWRNHWSTPNLWSASPGFFHPRFGNRHFTFCTVVVSPPLV